MRFEILELVEQYGLICPDCACQSSGGSRAEVEGEVRTSDQLEFVAGECGRCHKASTALIIAKSVLASRLKKIADAGMMAGPVGMIFALPTIAEVGKDIIERVGPELRKKARLLMGAYKAGKDAYTKATADQKMPQPLQQQPLSPTPPAKFDSSASATAEWLDAIRRSLIKKLNKIDGVHRRDEPLGKRIERLRIGGNLSPDVANAMRQITRLRNMAVYNDYLLVAKDCERLGAACSCLENWSRSSAIN